MPPRRKAGAAPLRSVGKDEAPPAVSKEPMSVSQAAESGDELDLLLAMRRRLSTAVDRPDCPYRDLASLTKRLGDVSRDIAAIEEQRKREGEENVTTPDEGFSTEAL